MGCKKLELDPELIRKLSTIHCTLGEIALVCNCHVDTLTRNYREQIDLGKAEGKTSLRRSMFKAAEKGNVSMMIFLAKNILGMTDRPILDDQDINRYTPQEIQTMIDRATAHLASRGQKNNGA